MPPSRRTNGHSDRTSATDAATVQPPGRHEVGNRGRRIPARLLFLMPSTEPTDGEAAGRNEAHEQRGHEPCGCARTMNLRRPSYSGRRIRDGRLAAMGGGSQPEPRDGSGPDRSGRGQAACRTRLGPHARLWGAGHGGLAGTGLWHMETTHVRRRGWRGNRPRRRRVCAGGALPTRRLGHGRRSLRRRLARRLGLLSRGGFGGRGLGGLDVRSGRAGGGTRWQKALGVQVAGFVRSLANAEVYVGLGPFAHPARAEGAHLCALGD